MYGLDSYVLFIRFCFSLKFFFIFFNKYYYEGEKICIFGLCLSWVCNKECDYYKNLFIVVRVLIVVNCVWIVFVFFR